MHKSARHLLLPALLLSACGTATAPPGNAADAPAQAPATTEAVLAAEAAAALETGAPNTRYKAAQQGQTRAPGIRQSVAHAVEEVATGLEFPWSLEFLPDGRVLVTEKGGTLRFVTRDGRISAPGTGLPAVVNEGQGGLLDVALDPGFAQNRIIYWTYSEPRDGGSGTTLATGRLADGPRPDVSGVRILFRQMPTMKSEAHFGSRIAFGPDGMLYLTLGDRYIGRDRVPNLDNHFGKVVRLNRDGSVPADNPFRGRAGALPEIWSLGHRNPQGLAFRADGALWVIEHGPRGGDELNRIEKGRDYGWPVITYGIDYGGETIGTGISARQGLEQPVYYWDPVIAPSSLLYYDGAMFPEWRGSFFAGGLSGRLVRLAMNGDRVAGEEWLLADRSERYRDVRQGPDGAIWLVTDEGALLRVARR